MKIMVVGLDDRVKELETAIGLKHEFINAENANSFDGFDVIVDVNADQKNYIPYYETGEALLIVSAVKITLKEISTNFKTDKICGMNLLPGFIKGNLKEVSFINETGRNLFKQFAEQTNWKYIEVNDSIGMVTPRVLSMIINEAANTLKEGTATMEDIDHAMIMGTNYPFGPFTWCDKIGVSHIEEILESLFESTMDNRYKSCSILKEKKEKQEKFY